MPAVSPKYSCHREGEVPGFQLKDEQKLYQVAMDFGVEIGDRSLERSPST